MVDYHVVDACYGSSYYGSHVRFHYRVELMGSISRSFLDTRRSYVQRSIRGEGANEQSSSTPETSPNESSDSIRLWDLYPNPLGSRSINNFPPTGDSSG
jgi:hypothetical protein